MLVLPASPDQIIADALDLLEKGGRPEHLRRALVKRETPAHEEEVKPQHPRRIPSVLGHDALVFPAVLGQPIGEQELTPAVEDEVFGDAQVGVEDHVSNGVFFSGTPDVDLEHEVEALAFRADDPLLTPMVLDVKDDHQIRSASRLIGVVDRQLHADVGALAAAPEEARELVVGLKLRHQVIVTFGRRQLRLGHRRRQRLDQARSALRSHRLPVPRSGRSGRDEHRLGQARHGESIPQTLGLGNSPSAQANGRLTSGGNATARATQSARLTPYIALLAEKTPGSSDSAASIAATRPA